MDMTKIRTLLTQAVLSAGMIYALLAIAVTPAFACTPTQCAALARDASAFCQAHYGTACGNATMLACDAGGFGFECETADFQLCGGLSGKCSGQ
jgi:hypothetical protein